MTKLIHNQKLKTILASIKPWATVAVIFLVLRYTGLLSGISVVTQSALMETGLLNIKPQNNVAAQPFNYRFTIKDMEGKEVDMNGFKGKVIFLNLWATWCGPCRAEMPSIQELYDKVDHEKIVFIMLSLDEPEHRNKIVRYIEDQKFSFPVYQPLSAFPNQLRVTTIPTTFVVGADGKIKMKKSGTANYATEEFQQFLEKLTVTNP
ncbi:MAG TPA: TlpA disulfide reductase family protein [Chryseosolibacter sp.]|nr:TlpA disulfide reductase family protein [Chryseosolibacter sp.]